MRKLVSPSGRWRFIEPKSDTDSTPVEFIMTEDEIINQYFGHWCSEMLKRGFREDINEQSCIEDFVVVNWAEPVVDHLAMELEGTFEAQN